MITATKKKIAWRIGLLTLIFIGLQVDRLLADQNLIWVTVEETAPITSDNMERARMEAMAAAERAAVAEALATGISIEALLVNLRLSRSLVEAVPYGKVIEKEILDEGPALSMEDYASHEEMLYRIRLRAGVSRETGGKDPSFILNAAINQSVLKEGEELRIHIKSTKDCFVAIYNILDDNKIIRLLPNYMSSKHFLKAGDNFIFPEARNDKKGSKLIVHLPKNKKKVTETIYILALSHPHKLNSDVQEGIWGIFNGKTASMNDLVREVVSIPLGRRAEALMKYEILKAN